MLMCGHSLRRLDISRLECRLVGPKEPYIGWGFGSQHGKEQFLVVILGHAQDVPTVDILNIIRLRAVPSVL